MCQVSFCTVNDILKLYKDTGCISPKRVRKYGRKHETTSKDDFLLLKMAKDNPWFSSINWQKEFTDCGSTYIILQFGIYFIGSLLYEASQETTFDYVNEERGIVLDKKIFSLDRSFGTRFDRRIGIVQYFIVQGEHSC